MRARVLAVLLLVACRRPAPTPTPTPTPSPSPTPSALHRGAARADAIVRAWNAAINAHDADALGRLYADEIELYGERVARAKAVAEKRAAFAWHVRDDLDAIATSDSGRVTFHKKSTLKGGKVIDVVGYLDVRDGAITSEGDTTTDKNLARARAVGCESAVLALVEATPEAKKVEAEILKAAPSMPEPVTVSGMALAPDADRRDWAVDVCEDHPDRMTCLHHFLVSPATGTIRYEPLGDDSPHPIAGDPALAARVRAACKP